MTKSDTLRQIDRLEQALLDMAKMRSFIDHQERELRAELWEARERLAV